MTTTTRTLADHLSDKRELAEALAYFANELGRTLMVPTADVLDGFRNRSVYGLRSADGVWDMGTVFKSESMWRFESKDGIVIRAKDVNTFAVRVL